MKKITLIVGGLAVLFCLWWVYTTKTTTNTENGQEEVHGTPFVSEEYGISFSIPDGYFLYEISPPSVERELHAVILLEDTLQNRALVAGEVPGTEAPPAITLSIFQNNLDAYTAESFVKGTNFSNFKLSNGGLTTTTVDGVSALRFNATGLYENDNVVVALPSYVYLISGSYFSLDDPIRTTFTDVLASIRFNEEHTKSAIVEEKIDTALNEDLVRVEGKVTMGPMCPVMREGDTSCDDKAYQTVVQVFVKDSTKGIPLREANTDTQGVFSMMLPAGNYLFRAKGGSPFPSCSENIVSVIATHTVQRIMLSCDTGIR